MIFIQKCTPKREFMHLSVRRIASVVTNMSLQWSYLKILKFNAFPSIFKFQKFALFKYDCYFDKNFQRAKTLTFYYRRNYFQFFIWTRHFKNSKGVKGKSKNKNSKWNQLRFLNIQQKPPPLKRQQLQERRVFLTL